jgi:hypothetical protein
VVGADVRTLSDVLRRDGADFPSVVSLPASVEIPTDTWDVAFLHTETSHSRSPLN